MQRTSFYNSKRFRIAGAVIGTICALLPVFAPAGVVLVHAATQEVDELGRPIGGTSQPSNTPAPPVGTALPNGQIQTASGPQNPSQIPTTITQADLNSSELLSKDNNTSRPDTPSGPAGGGAPMPVEECTNVSSCLTYVVYFFAVSVPTTFAYITTTAFSGAVNWSLKSTSYSMDFVAAGWETTRDVANMAFLFIIIYIAISIMVQAGTAGNMQTLSRVILVALFINFSFFGTRVVIDLGNEAAVIIYNLLPGTAPDKVNGGFLGQIGAKDLSLNVMNALKPQYLLSDKTFNIMAKEDASTKDVWTSAILKTALYISLGVVLTVIGVTFLVASIHFVSRMALLWMLVIVSPLALVAYTIKGPDKYFSQWLHELISQAFYPFYFLGVYMLLLIFMAGISVKGGIFSIALGSFDNTSSGLDFSMRLASTVGVMVLLTALTVTIIKQAMKFAEEMGGRGGKMALGVGDWVNKQVVGGYTNTLRGRGLFNAPGVSYIKQQAVGYGALAIDKRIGRFGIANTVAGTAVRGVLQKAGAPVLTSQKAKDARYAAQASAVRGYGDEQLLKKAGSGADLTDDEKKAFVKISKEMLGANRTGAVLNAAEMTNAAKFMSKAQMDSLKGGLGYSKETIKTVEGEWKNKYKGLADSIAATPAGQTVDPKLLKELHSISTSEMSDDIIKQVQLHLSERQAKNIEKDTTGLYDNALKDTVAHTRAEAAAEKSRQQTETQRVANEAAANRQRAAAEASAEKQRREIIDLLQRATLSGTHAAESQAALSALDSTTSTRESINSVIQKMHSDLANTELERDVAKEKRMEFHRGGKDAEWTRDHKGDFQEINDTILQLKENLTKAKEALKLHTT